MTRKHNAKDLGRPSPLRGRRFETRLAAGPGITVPAITLEGDDNGAPHADGSAYTNKFSGKYAHRIIKGGVGRNLPHEAPQALAHAVVEVDGF